MIVCPHCKKEFSEVDEPCKKCLGVGLVPVKDAGSVGASPADLSVEGKKKPCPRCNGNGTERSAHNRHSRSRGASNEAKAVKTFTEWWVGPGGEKYEFRRTPQSGGSALAAGFGMAGDICTNAPDWPFHVEAKRDKGWDFEQLFTTEGGARIGEFAKQALADAPEDKIPLLFMMHPGPSQPTFIMLLVRNQSHHFTDIEEKGGVAIGKLVVEGKPVTYYIMSLKKFIGYTPNDWRHWAKWYKVAILEHKAAIASLSEGRPCLTDAPPSTPTAT